MDEGVGRLPQDTQTRAEWQAKLRKEGLTSCRLPENVVFGSTSERAGIQLPKESVSANMQSDIGAVEAWAAALLVHCKVKEVGVQLSPDAAASGGGHLERLLYRLHRFGGAAAGQDRRGNYSLSKALMSGKLLLNVPSDDWTVAREVERLKSPAGTAILDLALASRARAYSRACNKHDKGDHAE